MLTRIRFARRRRVAFTLIELLVVVAVIAVLAGLLMPVLAAARARARQTTCLSNMRQIARAQLLYMDAWDERFPHWNFPAPPRPGPLGDLTYWTEFFAPYLRCEAVLRCPDSRWIWPVPENYAEFVLSGYVLGTWGQGGKGTRERPYWNWPGPAHTLTAVPRPAETITVIDGFTTREWSWVDLRRHRRGTNASFVDGHARWITEGAFRTANRDGDVWFLRYASADR